MSQLIWTEMRWVGLGEDAIGPDRMGIPSTYNTCNIGGGTVIGQDVI